VISDRTDIARNMYVRSGKRGHAVAHLVEALRYKPEDRGSIPDGVIGIFH
jgi:hypothetical protein